MKDKISFLKQNIWVFVLAVCNILIFAAVVFVNYLANALPIWWMSTWALSDLYPNLFVPAALTFSIWWVIYLLILWFVIWQMIDFFKKDSLHITKKIGIWFLLSCMANIAWIFSWHYRQVFLSVLVMICFLIILIIITKKISIGEKLWSWKDKLFAQIPFSVYLWWISVAIIANISARLVHIWWNMWWMTDIFWTIVVIVVAALLALWNLYKRHDIVFALVVVWAFIWIIIKRNTVDPTYSKPILLVLAMCVSVLITAIGLAFHNWRKK